MVIGHTQRNLIRVAICVLALGQVPEASATPEAANWRRQTLIGETQTHFFRYVAVSTHPGSYYGYTETLHLEKVRKSDHRIVESFKLRDVSYSQDMNSKVWSEVSEPLDPFDVAGFLQSNKVRLTFSDDLFEDRTFAIDSAGVWEVFEDGRVQMATRKELERQIPDLGEDPRVAGLQRTGPCCGGVAGRDSYLRILSGSSSWDDFWCEDLLRVPGDIVR
jgi:hypothetical protein